jgi:chromate reductase, NAD(P)H dehydrogenase (quinone)
MRNVALIIGSLRKESYTRKVGNALIELASSSLRIQTVEIGDLPLYNQDLDTERPPPPWVEFRDRLRDKDGVIFATPEYNRSVPGVLKNALDVGSRPYGKSVLTGKPAGVISVSPGQYGGFGANHHLRQSLVFLDMPVLQAPEMYLAKVGDDAFDAQGKLTAERTRGLLQQFITAYAEHVERYAHARAHDSAA